MINLLLQFLETSNWQSTRDSAESCGCGQMNSAAFVSDSAINAVEDEPNKTKWFDANDGLANNLFNRICSYLKQSGRGGALANSTGNYLRC